MTTGMFLAEIVHDVIITTGNWKVALEHFLLYVQKIDSGCGWELANASAKGSHDTFMNKALKAAGVTSPLRPSNPNGGKNSEKNNPPPTSDKTNQGGNTGKSWNGDFNKDPNAKPCAAFNSNSEHRPQSLNSNGSCKFCHKCDQWVSNKGPGGRCESTSHSRSACNNSHKCENKVE